MIGEDARSRGRRAAKTLISTRLTRASAAGFDVVGREMASLCERFKHLHHTLPRGAACAVATLIEKKARDAGRHHVIEGPTRIGEESPE